MKDSTRKILYFLYGPFIRIFNFFVTSYRSNRKVLDDFLSREKVSSLLRALAVIFLILWVVIFAIAPEEKRKELTQTIKQNFEQWRSPAGN